jgi:hypothetical protein
MTSNRMGKQIENATSSHSYQRLTPDNSVLVLIDHQVGHLLTIKDLDQEELRHRPRRAAS